MKKTNLISLIISLLFIANVSFSQESTDSSKIEFDKTEHDFGTINFEGDGNCVFTFKNTGNAPLLLSNVRSSCGCTVPQWPRQPILPGESGEIKVKYDTKRLGAFNKSITVMTNSTTPQVVLRIKGNVQKAE